MENDCEKTYAPSFLGAVSARSGGLFAGSHAQYFLLVAFAVIQT